MATPTNSLRTRERSFVLPVVGQAWPMSACAFAQPVEDNRLYPVAGIQGGLRGAKHTDPAGVVWS